MKGLVEQGFAGSNVYRALKQPAYRGQLRVKSWRYDIMPSGADDPVWLKRAIDYWLLQQRTFGLKFEDDVQIIVDYTEGIVSTTVHVAGLMPGRREVDFKVPELAS